VTLVESMAAVARAAANHALDLALPPRCSGCRREGSALCRECRSWLLARVASPPGEPIGLPADIPEPLVQLEWCAPFTGIVRRAVHDLKYAGEQRLARPLGEAVAARWRQAAAGGDVLVPVPASPDRIRDRGYDQAVLLANVVGGRLGLPVIPALERVHATAAQHALGRSGRAENVGHAFRIRAPDAGRAIRGRWIVLVDDVVTTGATLAACGQALMDAGAGAVSAVTVARER
jgi:ComF family protein